MAPLEPLYSLDGGVNWYNFSEEEVWQHLIKLKMLVSTIQ